MGVSQAWLFMSADLHFPNIARLCVYRQQFRQETTMQQVENCREEEATVDVQFTDLPNALIACKVPEDLFNEGSLKVSTFLHRRWHFIY